MTNLERYNPVRESERTRNWLNRWFEDSFGPMDRFFLLDRPDGMGILTVDVTETEKDYQLKASLPGYKPENIQVEINQDMVTLRGEHHETFKEEKKPNYIYRERHEGSFYRQLRLPQPVDSEKTEAALKDGILTLTLPKLAPTSVRRVPITNGQPKA